VLALRAVASNEGGLIGADGDRVDRRYQAIDEVRGSETLSPAV
jgi:hypothetical protein